MPAHLYLAPAAAGKTSWVLERAYEQARSLQCIPRVCLPSSRQVQAWKRRLAARGGALGIRLLTFDRLYTECLNAAGLVYVELSEPVQYRLLRALVQDLALVHYAPLADRPGFIQVLQRLIAELKGARILPERFAAAVAGLGNEPRLEELARIYSAYQQRLQENGWADHAGMAWLAVAALEQGFPHVARDWPFLVVDGFDNFTGVQVAMLKALAGRVGEMAITLTGDLEQPLRPVHQRFDRTRERLEKELDVFSEPLPATTRRQAPALAHLEEELFATQVERLESGGAIELTEAPDRAAEVRAALRWLKERLLHDRVPIAEVALLARSVEPYRPFIRQTAAEFGLPVYLADGLPLRTNPAVTALLDLLRLMLPRAADDPSPALPRRLVVEAWRSPYLDWSGLAELGRADPVGIEPGDADLLDAAAHWGQVIGGHEQWEEMLAALAARQREPGKDEEQEVPAGLPLGQPAQALLDRFRRFVRRLTPPPGAHTWRDFVSWLEDLIGPDLGRGKHSPNAPLPPRDMAHDPFSLRVVVRARTVAPPGHSRVVEMIGLNAAEVAEGDIAALQTFKDVLRGLVWAEEAIGPDSPIDLPRFFADLTGAVDANSYLPPLRPGHESILVADVVQARGLPFRAVAVLGLAEGEFPATLGEDPFLRDADRRRLRQEFGFDLELSTQSAEIEFFYETVTRPWERLLLTRPRLADNGALWQFSPFWEEVRRLLKVEPQTLTSEKLPLPAQAASWAELLESLSSTPAADSIREWAYQQDPACWEALAVAGKALQARGGEGGTAGSPMDGDLRQLAGPLGERFGPRHSWSASRLESYRTCPFFFFIGHVLGLEPREEPAEGLDARQLGTIYHRIFEELYQAVEDPGDLDQLLARLPEVAGRILKEAPARDGFRVTAWWAQTCAEIQEKARRSVEALAAMPGGYRPVGYEAAFGFQGQPELVIPAQEGQDRIRLHGFIDRVDRDPAGRLRIIDYKTSGPGGYKTDAISKGKKLQLPLYALAAQNALQLGTPDEGFYWHVQQGEASQFKLSQFGARRAMDTAVEKSWEAVRGIRAGNFVPQVPEDGCPKYCPAATFCWHYQPGY